MIDYSLYLVTDLSLSCGRSNLDIVQSAVQGGVTCVQLREKNMGTRQLIEEARILKKLLKPLSVPLIINDRVDVAIAVNAEGVHLGQTDMKIEDARRITKSDLIIGISAESLEDAITAEQQGADYIGISPVFATSTKNDTAPPLGLDGVKELREHTKIPLVGIGGINADNAKNVIDCGADGVAVVSAIVSSSSPFEAARKIAHAIKQ